MSISTRTTSLSELKAQARRLTAALAADAVPISHGKALELIARQHGARDWNTLSAQLRSDVGAADLALGQRVRGAYLGHPFEGRVKGLREIGRAGHREVIVQFDAPIDVVRSESFSSERTQVACVLDRHGRSPRKTSNGAPLMALEI